MQGYLKTLLFLGVVLAATAVLPHLVGDYTIEVLILFLINLILVVSYRIPATTGDWSLSHVVLMGCGAYATAILTKWYGLSIFLTVPLSAVIAAIVGLIIVTPLIRTRGFGFFIASFALGELVRLIWIKFRDPFGGPRGMIGIPSGEIGAIDFFEPLPYYYFVLVVALICLFVMYRIDQSRIGKSFRALYTDEGLAESVGIDVPRYRAMAFTMGAFFAGIAGSLLAHRLGAVDPKNFDISVMVYLIIWIVVGGSATFWGPIIGLVAMTFVFDGARVSGKRPSHIARAGLVRTFQRNAMFATYSVLENVMLARHTEVKRNVFQTVFGSRSGEDEHRDRAREIIRFLKLGDHENELARNLSHGHQRILGIANALATEPKLIMLDEPMAGLNPTESALTTDHIRRLRDEWGMTVILVEHDMRTVMGTCEYISVINFGEMLMEGTPAQVANDKSVIEAYLGSDEYDL